MQVDGGRVVDWQVVRSSSSLLVVVAALLLLVVVAMSSMQVGCHRIVVTGSGRWGHCVIVNDGSGVVAVASSSSTVVVVATSLSTAIVSETQKKANKRLTNKICEVVAIVVSERR